MGILSRSKQLIAYTHCRAHLNSHADMYLYNAFLKLTLKICVQRRSVCDQIYRSFLDFSTVNYDLQTNLCIQFVSKKEQQIVCAYFLLIFCWPTISFTKNKLFQHFFSGSSDDHGGACEYGGASRNVRWIDMYVFIKVRR